MAIALTTGGKRSPRSDQQNGGGVTRSRHSGKYLEKLVTAPGGKGQYPSPSRIEDFPLPVFSAPLIC